MPESLHRRRQPSPVEMASALSHEGDVVFLDSALAGDNARSIVASRPLEIIRGSLLQDQGVIRDAIMRHATTSQPSGGLFGIVRFDGSFVFGVFPQCDVFMHDQPLGNEQVQNLPQSSLEFRPLMEKGDFVRRVHAAREYIAAGDIYQVNLSYPWAAVWPSDAMPWAYYERLRAVSPSPFGAFIQLDGETVFSASPECFLKMNGRRIQTQPIKGTRPRGMDELSDRGLATELQASAKERAELVMITDLERNDLGQVCEFGSVRVAELLKLEKFAQVHHLVSTVEGTLRADVDHLSAFVACFPGGSISGAPKKRALEIIAELEPHERGLYTGAIGYFGFNGESQFSIAIRTAWLSKGMIRFHTGAGIVADSIAELEHEETRHKAAGLLAAARA
jgi:para-aminobenzoate synthetase component 1